MQFLMIKNHIKIAIRAIKPKRNVPAYARVHKDLDRDAAADPIRFWLLRFHCFDQNVQRKGKKLNQMPIRAPDNSQIH
jgi:hypothetical protein